MAFCPFRCPHIPPDTAIVAVLKEIAQIFLILRVGITYRLLVELATADRHKQSEGMEMSLTVLIDNLAQLLLT